MHKKAFLEKNVTWTKENDSGLEAISSMICNLGKNNAFLSEAKPIRITMRTHSFRLPSLILDVS